MIFNIVNSILLFIVMFFVSKFSMINGFDFWILTYPLILSIVITMLYKRKNIKKYKLIYNIILILFVLLSIPFVGNIIYVIINCSTSPLETVNIAWNNQMVLLLLVLVLFLFNIFDIKEKKSKTNYIITWLVSIIVIIIYCRYYYDVDFIHNYMYRNQYQIQDSYIYITQNYIYFNILYLSVLIHYLMNKK